jgi:hypothetical protein
MDTTQAPLDRVVSIKLLWRLPQSQAMLLDQLLTARLVPLDDIIKAGVAPTYETARSVVCRLRAFLKKQKIKLQSAQSTGYWLEQIDKDLLAAMIHQYDYPER